MIAKLSGEAVPTANGPTAQKTSRLLLLSEIFPPKPGGSGRWFFESYRRIQSHACIMAVGQHPQAHAIDQACPTLDTRRYDLHMPFRGIARWQSLRQYGQRFRLIRELTRTEKCCQIHAARPLFEGLVAKLVAATTGIPYLCYVHGEDISVAKTSRELTMLTQWVLRSAHALVANSEFTRGLLQSDWKLDANRIRVIHPGVDTQYFQPAEPCAKTRRELGWGDRPVVLTVGRLQARKGHDVLIRSLPQIMHQIPNVLYAIVGDGEQYGHLKQLTSTLSLQDHVIFHREISDELLLACYQQCDLFCLPNRQIGADVEGFGMVLLEAQACGKPVIAGDSGGTAETMEQGVTGMVVNCTEPQELAGALAGLLGAPDERHRLGVAGRHRICEHFDWQAIADQSSELFSSICP